MCFKIQCKKYKNKITIHFLIFLHYKEFTQQYQYEKSLQKFVLILFTKTFNQNATKNPCFVEIKTTRSNL
jgi:hypothetical protein